MERDVIEALLQEISLPDHLFDNCMRDTAQYSTSHQLTAAESYINLLEVLVDDFIVIRNNSSQDHLRQFARHFLF